MLEDSGQEGQSGNRPKPRVTGPDIIISIWECGVSALYDTSCTLFLGSGSTTARPRLVGGCRSGGQPFGAFLKVHVQEVDHKGHDVPAGTYTNQLAPLLSGDKEYS
jgi:hypothetical protein